MKLSIHIYLLRSVACESENEQGAIHACLFNSDMPAVNHSVLSLSHGSLCILDALMNKINVTQTVQGERA